MRYHFKNRPLRVFAKGDFLVILKILVSMSLLTFLCWLKRDEFGKISNLLKSADLAVFGLAFLVLTGTPFFLAWRLKIVLSVQKAFFAMKDLFALTFIGYFFNNFMPTSVGGDLVKGYYISKKIQSRSFSYASVLVDRVVGMFSLILIAGIATLIMREKIEHQFIFWTVGLLLLFCLILILSYANKGWLKKIWYSLRLERLLRRLKLDVLVKKAYAAVNVYTNRKEIILQMLILSLIAQVIAFFSIYLLAISLGVSIPFGKILLIMPIISILLMLPITFNGLGLREWSFVFFFSPKIGDAAALSLSLLFFATYLLVSLIGGIIYLLRR